LREAVAIVFYREERSYHPLEVEESGKGGDE
jgi:hypothetical protein